MIQLPATYSTNSHDFKIIDRDNDTAIAEQYLDGELIAYEVFIIKKSPANTVFGKDYPARELVPSNEEWGTLAYSPSTLEGAKRRREDLRRFLSESENRRLVNP